MSQYILIKKVKGLPYKVGDKLTLHTGNRNQLLWHVWTTIIEVPHTSVKAI